MRHRHTHGQLHTTFAYNFGPAQGGGRATAHPPRLCVFVVCLCPLPYGPKRGNSGILTAIVMCMRTAAGAYTLNAARCASAAPRRHRAIAVFSSVVAELRLALRVSACD